MEGAALLRPILLVFALVLAVVSAFVDALPVGSPRVRLLPLAVAFFVAAFLFAGVE